MKPNLTVFDYIVYSQDADFNGINNFIAKYGYQPTSNRMRAVESIKAIVRDNEGASTALKKDLMIIHPDKDLFESEQPKLGMNNFNMDGDALKTPDQKVKAFFTENSTSIILGITIISVVAIIYKK